MSHFASAPWCKFYGTTPAHLTYPKKTIYQMIRATCEKFPNLPAYEFMGKVTTYREFLQRIDLTARAYYGHGHPQGRPVTICMPNCPQAVDSFYAPQPHRRGEQYDPSPVRRQGNCLLSELLPTPRPF